LGGREEEEEEEEAVDVEAVEGWGKKRRNNE
jgi:hypothetical protein